MAYERHKSSKLAEHVVVVSSELRGVSAPLDPVNQLLIGFKPECDIVLTGEAGDASEAILHREDGVYRLEALAGKISVGSRHLKPHKTAKVSKGAPFSVGSVDLMIARSSALAEYEFKSYQQKSVGVAWAATLGLVVISIGAVASFKSDKSSGAVDVQRNMEFEKRTFHNTRSDSLAATEALRSTLSASGLKLSVIEQWSDRVILVAGTIRETEEVRWAEVQTWFDTQYGDAVQLNARIKTVDDAVTLPFMVEAIWMDPTPRLTLHDGSQRQTGDALPGGWRLEGISVDKVEISKDGRRLIVPL